MQTRKDLKDATSGNCHIKESFPRGIAISSATKIMHRKFRQRFSVRKFPRCLERKKENISSFFDAFSSHRALATDEVSDAIPVPLRMAPNLSGSEDFCTSSSHPPRCSTISAFSSRRRSHVFALELSPAKRAAHMPISLPITTGLVTWSGTEQLSNPSRTSSKSGVNAKERWEIIASHTGGFPQEHVIDFNGL